MSAVRAHSTKEYQLCQNLQTISPVASISDSKVGLRGFILYVVVEYGSALAMKTHGTAAPIAQGSYIRIVESWSVLG